MPTDGNSRKKMVISWPFLLSAAIGGIFCTFADILKNNQSLVLSFKTLLQDNFSLSAVLCFFVIFTLLPLLSIGLCFVFEPKEKVMAFYMGASILALAFNFIPPVQDVQLLKSYPNSGKINVIIETEQKELYPNDILITVRNEKNTIVGRTRFTDLKNIFFYLDNGKYKMKVESSGYMIFEKEIAMVNDQEQKIVIILTKSAIPLGVQNFLK